MLYFFVFCTNEARYIHKNYQNVDKKYIPVYHTVNGKSEHVPDNLVCIWALYILLMFEGGMFLSCACYSTITDDCIFYGCFKFSTNVEKRIKL